MDDSALDKLIADIQEFLRSSDAPRALPRTLPREDAPGTETQAAGLTTRAMAKSARLSRLLEVCAYLWAVCLSTVVGALLWVQRPLDTRDVTQMFVFVAFGLFTTLALLGGAQRIATLLRIERNTREILRLRRRQNALLARLVDRT